MMFQEYNNSVYRTFGKELIEKNLLTKRELIHFRSAYYCEYYISKLNKIIVLKKLGTILWNNKTISVSSPINNYVHFLEHDNQVYVCFHDGYNVLIYDFDGNTNHWKGIRAFDVAIDSLFFSFNGFYNYVPSAHIKHSLNFKELPLTNPNITGTFVNFVKYSNCLTYSVDFVADRKHIKNLVTGNSISFYGVLFEDFFANTKLLFHIRTDALDIYDVNNLSLIRSIACYDKLFMFHEKLGVLVSQNYNCYELNDNHDLKKIQLGDNYMVDQKYIQHMVMNIIVDTDLLFDCISPEILYIILYQQIIILT